MNVKVKRQWISGLMKSISFSLVPANEREKAKISTIEYLIDWH